MICKVNYTLQDSEQSSIAEEPRCYVTHVFHTITAHTERRAYKIYSGNNVVKINTQAASSATANEKTLLQGGCNNKRSVMWTSRAQMRLSSVAKNSRCLLLPKMNNFYTLLISATYSIISSLGCETVHWNI